MISDFIECNLELLAIFALFVIVHDVSNTTIPDVQYRIKDKFNFSQLRENRESFPKRVWDRCFIPSVPARREKFSNTVYNCISCWAEKKTTSQNCTCDSLL